MKTRNKKKVLIVSVALTITVVCSLFLAIQFEYLRIDTGADGGGGSPLPKTIVVIQAHSDDFDISLSGQAFMAEKTGTKIIIVTITDCEADEEAYSYGLSLRLFSPDAIYNGIVTAPNNETYYRRFYSHNCGVFRLNDMKERYTRHGSFTSIIPNTKIPDSVEWYSNSVQIAYINAVQEELLSKLRTVINSNTYVTFFVHDILIGRSVGESYDHVIAGKIGEYIYKTKYQYYVYTTSKVLPIGYYKVDVSSVYYTKVGLYDDIFEVGQPSVPDAFASYFKNPHAEDKYFFMNEIRKG